MHNDNQIRLATDDMSKVARKNYDKGLPYQ